MNRLPLATRAMILRLFVSKVGIRKIAENLGISKTTVQKFIEDFGRGCAQYHHDNVRGLQPDLIEVDELWSFVLCKEKNIKPEQRTGTRDRGSVWTWIALYKSTKLMVSWYMGDRSIQAAVNFMKDIALRVDGRPTINSDGLKHYAYAIKQVFGDQADYGKLVKQYDPKTRRYKGAVREVIQGSMDESKITTSHVERVNLSIRVSNARYVRKTDTFSKLYRNHYLAQAIIVCWYNYTRKHSTLKTTPAVAAGLVDKPWTIEEMIEIIDKVKLNKDWGVLLSKKTTRPSRFVAVPTPVQPTATPDILRPLSDHELYGYED